MYIILLQFTTAQVFDVKSSDNEFGVEQQDFVSPVRIQSVAWLFNDVHPRMSRIDRLLDHVTGLQISALNASSTAFVEAEEFQVRKREQAGTAEQFK